MEFSRFNIVVLAKLLVVSLVITGIVYSLLIVGTTIGLVVAAGLFLVLTYLLIDLFQFITTTNKNLTRFLESIQYSDFTLKFHSEKYVGKSFLGLNTAFNNVLAAFNKERAEKQAHLQYLNTLVRQVNIGLIAFNLKGEIELINDEAKNKIGLSKIKNIKDILSQNPQLYNSIIESLPGKSTVLKVDKRTHLAITNTTVKIKAQAIKIIVLKNIYSELQAKELEAWQNLTAVLRHEIMNSITPIASIISTLQLILEEDFIEDKDYLKIDKSGATDVKEGLETISNRAQGLISFIDAYRTYTDIPSLKVTRFQLSDLFEHIFQLMKVRLKEKSIAFDYKISPEETEITGDYYLLEMVLINLLSNAIDANVANKNAQIKLLGKRYQNQLKIEVVDNGQGIAPEAIDKIFIPFFTTKKHGSGIGLSLSSQILSLHKGTLTVESEYGEGTTFTLRIPLAS